MKILHVCLASSYTDGMTYQDNMLAEQNVADGHEVMVVSDCTHFENGKIVQTLPEDRVLISGVRLVRLPFDFILTGFFSNKLRKTKLLRPLLEQFAPDVILFHGCAGWELITVAKYKKNNPHIKLYVDSHEDFNNSARNWLSKNILHRLIYGPIIRYAYPYLDKLLYLSEETKDFLVGLYKLPAGKLEFYPLGGVVHSIEDWTAMRAKKRAELGLRDEDVLLCHSGKMDSLKRTKDILLALSQASSERIRLIIIGNIPDEMKPVLEPMIAADERVSFLGWKNGDELMAYLCACDMYVQPGSQSATMQNAICCGAPVLLYPHKSYKHFIKGNCWYVETTEEMTAVFSAVSANPEILKEKGKNSFSMANELLDYKKLAARLYK